MKTAKQVFNEMLEKNDECTSTEMMIEFAKIHVKEVLKAIKSTIKDPLESQGLYLSDDWDLEITGNNLIDDAYPLENIK